MIEKNRRLKRRCVGLALLVWLCGLMACQSRTPQPDDAFMEKWRMLAQESAGRSPTAGKADSGELPGAVAAPPAPAPAAEGVADSLPSEPPAEAAQPARTLPTIPVTLKMHEVDLKVLLRTLARAANQNMLINESVKGLATLSIQETPWDRVFTGLLGSQGLTYRWEGNIIRIVSIEDLKRDRELIEENQKILTTQKEYALKLKRLENSDELNQAMETRVIPVRFADPKTLRDNLEKFLKAEDGTEPVAATGPDAGRKTEAAVGTGRGAIFVDPHTNSLMIQARRRDLDRLLPLIAVLDRPTLQVRIEAHLVETSSETARELGIQWGGIYKHTTGDGVNHYVLPGAAAVTSATTTAIDPSSGLVSNFPIGSLTDSGTHGFNLGYIAENLGGTILNVQLSALQEDGKLDILSSPSITTLDNRKAVIESGSEVPYQTVENGEVKIEFKDAVLKLEVTPHVIDGKTIKLEISTENNEIDQANSVGGQPVITKKKAQTTVVLFDGQTTVIGGLSKNKGQNSEAGVPFFKDIPGLGYLFKSQGRSRQGEELLIFITPHILAPVGDRPVAG